MRKKGGRGRRRRREEKREEEDLERKNNALETCEKRERNFKTKQRQSTRKTGGPHAQSKTFLQEIFKSQRENFEKFGKKFSLSVMV